MAQNTHQVSRSKKKPSRGKAETKKSGAIKTQPNSNNKKFIVTGVVRNGDNEPVTGLIVRAYDQDVRKRQKLGEAKTVRDGRYTIPYRRESFCRAEKNTADLVVVAFNADDDELARSPI